MLLQCEFVRNQKNLYGCLVDVSIKSDGSKCRNLLISVDIGTSDYYTYEMSVMEVGISENPGNRYYELRDYFCAYLNEYHRLEKLLQNDGLLDKNLKYLQVVSPYKKSFKPYGFGGEQ